MFPIPNTRSLRACFARSDRLPGSGTSPRAAYNEPRAWALASLALCFLLALVPASASAAGPPVISATSFSSVTQSSATLHAAVDPASSKTFAHFEYTPLADYEASGFSGAQSTAAVEIPTKALGKGDLTTGSSTIENLITTAGAFGPGQPLTLVGASGLQPETTITAIGTDPATGKPRLTISKPATATLSEAKLSATGPQPLSAALGGLAAGTAYSFRLVAENSLGEEETGPTVTFYTLSAPPAFGPCPDDAFRNGPLAPSGHPSASLPDCRAYEQASPVDKDGGNAVGTLLWTRASLDGDTIGFGSSFGIPGGGGAQSLPSFQATRGPGEEGWTTRGLLPPEASGPKADVVGATPDRSLTYAVAERIGIPRTAALLELPADGGPAVEITPYAPFPPAVTGRYSFVGTSADASTVVFESPAQLPPGEGRPPIPGAVLGGNNVYAWDRSSGELHLAGVMNDESQSKAALPKGAVAGPYDFSNGTNPKSLGKGGASASYYTQDEHAVAADGSIYFTAAGSGQLYRRLNPTQPQSAVVDPGQPDEECTEPTKACTVHVSAASERPSPDTAGPQPAAFMAATADGSQALFTSAEKLTADANTGPDQPAAQIGRAKLNGEAAAGPVKEDFLPTHALGVAVDPAGEYIYWANPATGTIGRAKLNPVTGEREAENNSYVIPGPTEAETHPLTRHGVIESAPSAPRYVAVDGEYVYWTNTGPLGSNTNIDSKEEPVDGAGTIGRAKIGATEGEDPDPEFITGASNPQGIAVNSEHIYWANDGSGLATRTLGRALLGGGGVEQAFFQTNGAEPLSGGVALSPTYVYFARMQGDDENVGAFVARLPLEGGTEEFLSTEKNSKLRGIAVEGPYVFWVAKGEGAIGRIPVADFPAGPGHPCSSIPTCEPDFLSPAGTLEGLATSGEHLYWSVNGEAPSNPGKDLYRYSSQPDPQGHHLTDLTPDPSGNGAEVQGLLGASADGAYVYFAANGDLDGAGPAEPGNCQTTGLSTSFSGSCSIYLSHGGATTFVARVGAGRAARDSLDWTGTPVDPGRPGTYEPKSAFLSADGSALLFRSSAKLTGYDNHGTPELYRFEVGDPGPPRCVSCPPSGEAPTSSGPTLGEWATFQGLTPKDVMAAVASRLLSADGRRAFFETTEPLVAADTDGAAGCPDFGESGPACRDVYEWEAPGAGSCTEGGPGYAPLDRGCLYLLSPGDDRYPSTLADASLSGDDVFFFTRRSLVGSDTDELQDVYDARVGGGLAAQNPLPHACESAEACHGGIPQPPTQPAPATPTFAGPGDPPPNHKKPRHRKHHGKKHHHKKHHHKKGHHKKKGSRRHRTGSGQGAGR